MKNQSNARRNGRRGLTLAEVLISAFLMLGVVFMSTQFARLNNVLWQRGMADSGSQRDAQMAIQKIAPFIRKARRVGTAQSTRIMVQLPQYDTGGNLVVPMVAGDEVTFYLSNSTGSMSSSGTILWKAVNGVPDAAWSLSNGAGQVNLSSLAFTYGPSNESVTITVTASKQIGTSTQQFSTSQEVYLRNNL